MNLRQPILRGLPPLFGLGVLLLSSPASSATVADARAFLVKLYAHYPTPSHRTGFDPTGKSASAVFDPAMVALLNEDRRLTQPGDEGALEADPLCDCQDDGGLKVDIEPIRSLGPLHASATIDLHFTAERPPLTRKIVLDLVDVQGQWRIHEISSKDLPSLRDLLTQSNLEAAKSHK
jgi:hypothetical protein